MKTREIKFRFWLPAFKRFANKFNDGNYWDVEDWISPDTKNNVIPQQFTGLKDKNSREIYEGDIIKHTYYGSKNYGYVSIFEVRWTETGFISLTYINEYHTEILGNIFENPKLLELTKK